MKVITLLSKTVPKDVLRTQKSLFSAVKNGWKIGKRYSQINNKGLLTDVFVRGKAIKRNMTVTKDDIPAYTAMASSLLPFPGTTFAGYGLGHAIKGIIKLFPKNIK